MAGKLLGGAVGAAHAAADVARHLLWYVSYYVDAGSGARIDEAARKLRHRG